MTSDVSGYPGLWTVDATEDLAWADELDMLRDSKLDVGLPLPEVRRLMASRLADLRAEALATYNEQLDADYDYLGIPHANGNSNHTPETDDEKRAQLVRDIATKYPLLTWSEFRDQSPEETVWLVDGILAENQQAFIGAPAKYGKTWVAADLAVSVTTGTPFLARFNVPKPAPVIYLALEGQLSALRTRFGCIARAHGVEPDSNALDELYLRPRTPGINLANRAWADWIVEQVKVTGAKLLIVDVLRKAMPQLRESGDGATDFSNLIANLAPIADLGCAIEFLHHFLKRSEGTKDRSVLEMLVGSGALGGHADNVIGIGKREKDGQLIRRLGVECDGRDEATPEPFTISLDGDATGKHGGWCYHDTLTLRAVHDEPMKASEWEYADVVADWIALMGRRVSAGEITKAFGIPATTIKRHRDELQRRAVVFVDDGRKSGYQATNVHPTDATTPHHDPTTVATRDYPTTPPPYVVSGGVGGLPDDTPAADDQHEGKS